MANHTYSIVTQPSSQLHHAAAGPGMSRPHYSVQASMRSCKGKSDSVCSEYTPQRVRELWAHGSVMPLKARVWPTEAGSQTPSSLLLFSCSLSPDCYYETAWLTSRPNPAEGPLWARRRVRRPLCVSTHIYYMLWSVVKPHHWSWANHLCIPHIFCWVVASWMSQESTRRNPHLK